MGLSYVWLLAANSIFSIALKAAYTYVSWTSNFCRILQKDDIFISCDTRKLISIQFSRLKAWKLLHCYLDCHSLLLIFWKALTFGLLLSGWSDFSNYVHLPTFTLITQLDFIIQLMRHWAWESMGYIWFPKGHGWFFFMWCDPYFHKLLVYRFYEIFWHNVL